MIPAGSPYDKMEAWHERAEGMLGHTTSKHEEIMTATDHKIRWH